MKEYFLEHSYFIELMSDMGNRFSEFIDYIKTIPIELMITRVLDVVIISLILVSVIMTFTIIAFWDNY